jgi:hypothetical protein
MINYVPDQSRFKCVQELECNTLDQIKEEVMNWVVDNTHYLDEKKEKKFWHQIEYKQMARVCPSLLRFMTKIKMPIRQITVGLLTESMGTAGFVLHNGAPPLNFKINFPIYNTDDVWTEWYDIPEDDVRKLPTIINPYSGTEQYNFAILHDTVQDLYPCLLRYNMHNSPIIFNSYIPHRVMPGPDAKYPRIMLATIPMVDPIDLMLR